MSKLKKIIHIYNRSHTAYFPEENSDYYYLAGWSSAVARQIPKYTKKYVIENWRPDRMVRKQIKRSVQGVMCRIFPSWQLGTCKDVSPCMLRELRIQAKTNEILIHHHTIHRNSFYVIASIFRNVPIIAQHHGDSPSLARYNQNRKLRTLLSHFVEKRILKNVDYFFVLRKSEREFLSRFVAESQISLQTIGVDFDEFRPLDKMEVRKNLNLPENKKIILYVGKFYRLKGVDIILKVYQQLKRSYDVELVLIGGTPQHELYDEVKASGIHFYGILPHAEMPLYFNAADVYLLPAFAPNYRGIDVATIESLACGTPIVSTTLKDFPTEEWQELGNIPKNKSDVIKCVSEILDNPNAYRNCRETAKKYYDWKVIATNTIETYNMLFDKYYGNK